MVWPHRAATSAACDFICATGSGREVTVCLSLSFQFYRGKDVEHGTRAPISYFSDCAYYHGYYHGLAVYNYFVKKSKMPPPTPPPGLGIHHCTHPQCFFIHGICRLVAAVTVLNCLGHDHLLCFVCPHSCGGLMGGAGICYVNTFLVKVEDFPGGAALTMTLSRDLLRAGNNPTWPICSWVSRATAGNITGVEVSLTPRVHDNIKKHQVGRQ